MRRIVGFLTVCTLAAAAGWSSAQAGNQERLGVGSAQHAALLAGWSAKRDLMNKRVENGQKQRVGRIEDVIVTEKGLSAVIISTGGVAGIAQHDVALPVSQLQFDRERDQFILPGVTKAQLESLPEWKYPSARDRREQKSDSR